MKHEKFVIFYSLFKNKFLSCINMDSTKDEKSIKAVTM